MYIHYFNPAAFKHYIRNQDIYYTCHQTKAGELHILFTRDGIFQASFEKPATLFPHKELLTYEKLLLVGTHFQMQVWRTLLNHTGSVITYEQLAVLIDKPKAYRAVANALGKNKIAYFIPCHQVIRKDGSLGGYKWGLEKKKLLFIDSLNQ